MGSSDFAAVSETVNCVDKLADAVDLSLYMRSCGKAEYEKLFRFSMLAINQTTVHWKMYQKTRHRLTISLT